ncbi:MAG: tetratricopeptide repeat protein [Lacibacter sp.]
MKNILNLQQKAFIRIVWCRPFQVKMLLLPALLVIAGFIQAQPVSVQRCDQLEAEQKELAAYRCFLEVLQQNPHHLHALVRSSELASRIGRQQHDAATQIEYYQKALELARRALAVNPRSSDANMVMALASGRLALIRNGSEKVGTVRDIKSYAERALQLNPGNVKALHILGKWHYEVSVLTFWERTGARVFFGGLPKASLDSSIYFYEKVRSLTKGFLLNSLELAKAYEKAGKKQQALQLLREVLQLPPESSEDKLVKEEAARLLKAWSL